VGDGGADSLVHLRHGSDRDLALDRSRRGRVGAVAEGQERAERIRRGRPAVAVVGVQHGVPVLADRGPTPPGPSVRRAAERSDQPGVPARRCHREAPRPAAAGGDRRGREHAAAVVAGVRLDPRRARGVAGDDLAVARAARSRLRQGVGHDPHQPSDEGVLRGPVGPGVDPVRRSCARRGRGRHPLPLGGRADSVPIRAPVAPGTGCD